MQDSKRETTDNSLEKRMDAMPSVKLTLDYQGKDILLGLARWSKFVGVINIIFGFIYSLTIFFFSIPTVLMGILLIFLGARLTAASKNLKLSAIKGDEKSFSEALKMLSSYMFLQSTIIIIVGLLMVLALLLLVIFGVAVGEFFYESTQGFLISI